MANTRTINSPGVEVREIDLSTRAVTPVGTNTLVVGFAAQGPTYELVSVSSLSEFETAFGTPTNAAERYFYHSARQLITNSGGANVTVARLPYGSGAGEGISSEYSALAYPVIPVPSDTTQTAAAAAGTVPLSSAIGYYFGEPALVTLTEEQYNTVLQGGLNWATTSGNIGLSSFAVSGSSVLTNLGNAGMVVLNEAKTTINEKFEGYYFNLSDSFSNNPASNYDDVVKIKSIGSAYFTDGGTASYTIVPNTRIGFALSATYTAGVDSVSRDIENIPTFNIAASGYDDTVIASLVKVRPSPFSPNVQTLQYSLQEGYTGSLYANRQVQDPLGGAAQSFYLKTVVNDNSNAITVLTNPNISEVSNWLDNNGNSTKKVRIYKTTTGTDGDSTLYSVASAYLAAGIKNTTFNVANNFYALGVYADSLPTWSAKTIGDVGSKLDFVLNLAENPDLTPLDITVDAGLSTIYAMTQTLGLSAFDDTVVTNTLLGQVQALSASTGNPVSNTLLDSWNTITAKFEEFARNRRRDHVFVSDPLRTIFVTGENVKTLDDKTKNFSNNVYWPLRNSYTGYNSSYATSYANWVKVRDQYSSKNVWLPSSGFAAATICRSDAASFQWIAPAGLTRGVINGILDLGINPQQKQRDLIYKISLNPLVYFPNDGYVVMGQKTLLKAPSAFDRLNVRRLFLFLEKSTLQTMKYFVFEPNTTFTRSRVVNTLSPVFTLAKNTQGCYDYLIVCNETNNTSSVIDDNTLVVDIYIKPVRAAEFILVNFYATKTSQNFNELLQG
jgi:phage tail sheath protein FI